MYNKHEIIITLELILDWTTVLNAMKTGENNQSVFLSRVESNDQIGTFLSAMSNGEGGKVYLGIDVRNYHLVGTDKGDEWLKNSVLSFCRPQPEIDVCTVLKNEKSIIILTVHPSENSPVYFKNTCYVMDKHVPIIALSEKPDIATQLDSFQAAKGLLSDQTEDEVTVNSDDFDQINLITDELIELQNDDDEEPLIQHHLNDRQKRALEIIYSEKAIRNKTYREVFQVSHKTAHLELVDMVEKGYIKSTGGGRSTCYILATVTA